MKIAVGSTNPVKVEAVRQTISRIWSEAEIIPIAVPSGVSEMPMSDEETRTGARNRALAARDALGLGQPVEGFYWHISQAEPSGFTLADFGPGEAIQTAVEFAWEAIRGARQGDFKPEAPAGGCSEWCPAATFCWQYRAKAWR